MVNFESLTPGFDYLKGKLSRQPVLGSGSPSSSGLLHQPHVQAEQILPLLAQCILLLALVPVLVGSLSYTRSHSWSHCNIWLTLLGSRSLELRHSFTQNLCHQRTWTHPPCLRAVILVPLEHGFSPQGLSHGQHSYSQHQVYICPVKG
jgi:hypothetical protein